jgi:hypothetical protein
VWLQLWTYRRSGLEVYPGDPALARALGMPIRQVQDGLRFLEQRSLIERAKKPRGRATVPKRVIRLCPTIPPSGAGTFELPTQLRDLRRVCDAQARPQVDIAVMLGLWLICRERGHFRSRGDYSTPVMIRGGCLAYLLALSRNMPRKSIDRLAGLDLVRPTHPGDDWSSGLIVAAPWRWPACGRDVRQWPSTQGRS